MKTTIEINHALSRAAKPLVIETAALRTIVETALRRHLEAACEPDAARPRLRRHSFRGRGLQPGLSESNWAAIRARAIRPRRG
jgi:hypothetical protein